MAALKLLAAAAALSSGQAASPSPPGRWAAYVREASERFHIPAEWIRRVIDAESGGRTDAGGAPVVSRAGAMGLMQLMPATWRDMRVLLGLGPDPFEPRDNILAGSAYLKLMYGRFGYPGLFAAYNAGPARYSSALAGQRPLPAETRGYLARVAGPRALASPASARRDALFAIAARPESAPSDPAAVSPPLFVSLSAAARGR